jgi:hypothetical protein
MVKLASEIMVKTMFSGPEVHKEVLGLLDVIGPSMTELSIDDDETGWHQGRDERRLESAFDQAFQNLGKMVADFALKPGDPVSVGGMEILVPAKGEQLLEFDQVSKETRDLIVQLENSLLEISTGALLISKKTKPSDLTGEDLDTLVDALQEDSDWQKGGEEINPIFHALGASFGRHLVRRFGGYWVRTEEDALRIRNVGGIGIVVDPFQVTADRLQGGAPFGLASFCELCQTISDSLGVTGWRE